MCVCFVRCALVLSSDGTFLRLESLHSFVSIVIVWFAVVGCVLFAFNTLLWLQMATPTSQLSAPQQDAITAFVEITQVSELDTRASILEICNWEVDAAVENS